MRRSFMLDLWDQQYSPRDAFILHAFIADDRATPMRPASNSRSQRCRTLPSLNMSIRFRLHFAGGMSVEISRCCPKPSSRKSHGTSNQGRSRRVRGPIRNNAQSELTRNCAHDAIHVESMSNCKSLDKTCDQCISDKFTTKVLQNCLRF